MADPALVVAGFALPAIVGLAWIAWHLLRRTRPHP